MFNKTVQDLRELVGETITADLVDYYGGVGLSIPTKITRDHSLCLAVGFRYAELLVRDFGGQRLELPSERNYLIELRRQRDHKICKAFESGESIRSLAINYGLDRKMIQKILDRARIDRPEAQEVERSQCEFEL